MIDYHYQRFWIDHVGANNLHYLGFGQLRDSLQNGCNFSPDALMNAWDIAENNTPSHGFKNSAKLSVDDHNRT